MKILYITSDFFYSVGGIYQHIENLTTFIAKTEQVVIIYLNKENKQDCFTDSENRKIYLITNKGNQLQRLISFPGKEMERIISAEAPDIIHVHTLFESFKLRKNTSIPMIFTNHSSSYLKMYNNSFLRKFILPKTLQKFSLIISPSKELYNKTISKKSLMLSNGVNTGRFDKVNRDKINKSEVLNKFNIKYNNQLIFLSTRRLVDKNGILDFVKANINYFNKKTDSALYLIVGNGPEYETIKEIKKTNNLSNIYLLGEMENKKIDELYYIADFCVIPSKMEAISISALESMAAGCIVIANKVGGLAELIKDNINGVFLKNLSLEETLQGHNVDIYNEIRNNASEMVKDNYSWEKISQKTIDLYKNLLE